MKFSKYCLGFVVMLITSIASAHHSTAGYDSNKINTLSGTVEKFYWTNPHMFIYLLVPDEKHPGATINWVMEVGSPSINTRLGWKSTDVKPGDKVTIEFHPSRDGQHDGFSRIVWLANGEKRMCPGYSANKLGPAAGGPPGSGAPPGPPPAGGVPPSTSP